MVRDLDIGGKIIESKDMVIRKVRLVMTFWEEDGDVIRRHEGIFRDSIS